MDGLHGRVREEHGYGEAGRAEGGGARGARRRGLAHHFAASATTHCPTGCATVEVLGLVNGGRGHAVVHGYH